MSPDVARALAAIRDLPWRGIEIVEPRHMPDPAPPGRGPTARPRPMGETSARLLAMLRANPGWHRTRHLADGITEPSRRICSAMDVLLARGLVAKRPAGPSGGRGRIGMVYRALALACLLASCCGTASAHGWYTGLRSPTGTPCCSDQDCHPTEMCRLPDGREGIVSSHWGCIAIDWSKVLGVASPDGSPSICEPAGKYFGSAPNIYCIILGGAA